MKWPLVIAGLITASGAQAADQFDLICKGKMRFSVADPYEPRNSHLRLDLAAKQYCEGECKVTRPIQDVQPNHIMFESATEQEKALGTTFFHQIDRTSGKLIYFKSAKRPYPSWIEHDAMCEPAPFSGFPQLPKKF
jgi:hypothetical protein